MLRRLLIAGSALAVILPVSAFALSLGEIDLKSALNQPFEAEIPVTSATTAELEQLRVALASAETFERYGLAQPRFLTEFTFRVRSNSGGQTSIAISSDKAVVEPFVTMLLEVRWPQGRLLREYTVLLDPPVFEPAPVAPSRAPASSPAAPVARPQSAPPVSRPAPAPAAPVQRAPAAAPGSTFGPVERNDTLWGIARRVRPDDSVDVNQMMLAIFRANPEAFAGNINRLRAGAILRVPGLDELGELDRRAALNEVRRQNQAWRGNAQTAAPAEEARLRLVPPPAGGGEGTAAADAPATGQAAPATSAADAGRVRELEAELRERERLLELRNAELEALQNQLAALQQEESAVDVAVPAPETGAEELIAEFDDTDSTDDAAPAEPVAEPEPAAAEPATGMPPAVTTKPSEPSFISQLFTNIWLYVGLAVAVLLALFVARGRRRSEEPTGRWNELLGDDDSDADTRGGTAALSPQRESAEETFVVEESPAEGTDKMQRSGQTLELDRNRDLDRETPLEKTLSSDAALNLDQADPVAEAEFHMAYGLYDQAADLLIDAIKAEPGRTDLRRKLLDVYFVWENKGGFLREAQAFRDQVDTADPEWNKVLIMGKQLCPDEGLFAGQAAPTSAGSDMDLSLDEAGSDFVDLQFDDDDGDGDAVDLDLSAIREVSDSDMLDFDLGDDPDADVDLSPTALDTGSESPTVETPTIETAGPSSPTVETPTLETPMAEPTMETPTIESPAGDFGGLQEASDETASLDLDELGLDLDDFDTGEDEMSDDDIDDNAPTMLAGSDDEALNELRKGGLDATAEVESLGDDFPGADDLDDMLDGDATGEYQAGGQDSPDLDALTAALEKSTPPGSDTAEQPKLAVEDTAEQPRPDTSRDADSVTAEMLGDMDDLSLDFDIGEDIADADTPTGTLQSANQRPEGPTMTEVGTKLDLARAYIDMGDPDGARSILDEVIEEGDDSQRQEAQQMLAQLDD